MDSKGLAAVSSETAAPPQVSVIVAVLNCADTIAATLESIAGQQEVRVELLVADGGSGDGTWGVVQRFTDAIAWCVSESDNGIYAAWNKALHHAHGEYVCFLGGDDRFTQPDALGQLVEAGAGVADIVTCRSTMPDPSSGTRKFRGGSWDWDRLTRGMCVDNRGMLHRRELFASLGGFDESFRISGDYDFLLRAGPGIRTADVPDILVAAGAGGISEARPLARICEALRAQRKNRVGSAWSRGRTFAGKMAYLALYRLYHTGRGLARFRQR